MFPMISGGWLVGILDSDPTEDTTGAAPSVSGLLNKPRKEGRLGNFLTTFSVFTSGGEVLDSDPTEDTTEAAPSVDGRGGRGGRDLVESFTATLVWVGRSFFADRTGLGESLTSTSC